MSDAVAQSSPHQLTGSVAQRSAAASGDADDGQSLPPSLPGSKSVAHASSGPAQPTATASNDSKAEDGFGESLWEQFMTPLAKGFLRQSLAEPKAQRTVTPGISRRSLLLARMKEALQTEGDLYVPSPLLELVLDFISVRLRNRCVGIYSLFEDRAAWEVVTRPDSLDCLMMVNGYFEESHPGHQVYHSHGIARLAFPMLTPDREQPASLEPTPDRAVLSSCLFGGSGLAISPDGSVLYVGDASNEGRFVRYMRISEHCAASWQQVGQSALPLLPHAGCRQLAVSPDGQCLYMAQKSFVVVYSTLHPFAKLRDLHPPDLYFKSISGLVMSPDGRELIMADDDFGWAIDAETGAFLRQYGRGAKTNIWTEPNFGPGFLSFPRALALSPDGDELIVIDSGHHRLQRFDRATAAWRGYVGAADGKFYRAEGYWARAPDQEALHADATGLYHPEGVAFLCDGTLVVTDHSNHRVLRFE